jgi:DNA-binding response OmpR family regulator
MPDRTLAKVPIIMLTASGNEEDIARSYSLGTNAYVQKPVDFERFAAALANLAEFWVVIARLPRAA